MTKEQFQEQVEAIIAKNIYWALREEEKSSVSYVSMYRAAVIAANEVTELTQENMNDWIHTWE